MSPLDAGACPYLERVVEQEGAQTKQEIRAAVKRAWKKVDKGVCEGIMKRVRRNMSNVIRLNGRWKLLPRLDAAIPCLQTFTMSL